MKSNLLNLFVPEWQGHGVDCSTGVGAHWLRNNTFKDAEFNELQIAQQENLVVEDSILGRSSICKLLNQLKSTIEEHQPTKTFLLGGTCGIEVAPVSYLNRLYDGDLAVIWLDAHADLNTPQSSPSKHFHGMPLRTLLGQGDESLVELASPNLSTDQIFLCGVRDVDPPEQEFISENNIHLTSVQHPIEYLIDAIAARKFSNIYVHCDLDVLDPNEFDEMIFQVPNGISQSRLLDFIQQLTGRFNVVGSSLLEFVHKNRSNHSFLKQLRKGLLIESHS